MSAPKEVTELVAKWNARAEQIKRVDDPTGQIQGAIDRCADELEAALAAAPAVGEGAPDVFVVLNRNDMVVSAHRAESNAQRIVKARDENNDRVVRYTANTVECPTCGRVSFGSHTLPVDTTAPVWVDAETHDELVGRLTWRDEEGGYHEYSAAAARLLSRLRVAGEVQGHG